MAESVTRKMADDRVMTEERLLPYRDLLVGFDWPEQRCQWIATARIDEIIIWAEGARLR